MDSPPPRASGFRRAIACASAILPFLAISVAITLNCLPALRSGDKINPNADFYQYAARHEAVRKSLVEYHALPLQSPWLGGGYPTIADPEDPTFNPLVLWPVLFGTVKGLKLITYLALLIAGLSTYALARYVLGYTVWGALFSGLIYGIGLFIPLRVLDGNPNEVYAAFLPLGLLLLGLACRGHKWALVILPFVFCTMLSDGKLNALMAILFIGVLCVLELVPGSRALATADGEPSGRRVNCRPLKFFFLAMGLTALIGLPRFLPALELLHRHGGITELLAFLPDTYDPGRIPAYTFERLWKEAVGLGGRTGFVTVGWLPVVLGGIALLAYWRNLWAWGVALILFGWLAMAHHARVDLLKALWPLPVFEAIYRPDKYFSFPIAFVLAIGAGGSFSLLRQLHSRWVEGLIALLLIAFSLSFLYPKAANIQRRTYTQNPPALEPTSTEGFFQVEGQPLSRNRSGPPRSLAFYNLQRNIGTIDWYTGIPLPEHAVAKYLVDPDNQYQPNPKYRGEAYFSEPADANAVTAAPVFRPNSITVSVEVTAPGLLVINQNYHRDWHADHGRLIDQEGLLGLRLEEAGRYTIRLRYHPRSFYAGMAVAILSLGLMAGTGWARRTGRLGQWSSQGPFVPRRASQFLLWLID